MKLKDFKRKEKLLNEAILMFFGQSSGKTNKKAKTKKYEYKT